MNDERPENLLKSALEKIVYFEARSDQLSNDVEQVRGEADRLRAELASAAQREIELRRLVAELEVRVSRAHAEREESARATEALRRERAELVGKMLDASRIHQGGEVPAESIDLAAFIADLRSEVLDRPKPSPQVAAVKPVAAPVVAPPPAPTPLTRMASELKAQGRLDVSVSQLQSLASGATFPGQTEETLFGFSVRELTAPDPSARVRAAERLKALGHAAAAPALAAALHGERDERVLVALLGTFSSFARAEGVPVVEPLLASPSPTVRISALKALLTLDPSGAGPHLAAAVKDPDRAVRRRASLLALSLTGSEALTLGEQSIRDGDAEVRALAALVLGASGSAEAARPMLITAMRDPDLKVRKAAAQSLSRLLGQDVTAMVNLEDAQRRREVRKLQSVVAAPVLAVSRPAARSIHAALHSAVQTHQPVTVTKSQVAVLEVTTTLQADAAAQAVAAERAQAAAAAAREEQLTQTVMFELRSAIRGRQLSEVADAAGLSVEQAQKLCASLEAKHQVVRRGGKYFVA